MIIENIKLVDLTFKQLNNQHVCSLYFKSFGFNNIVTKQRLKSIAMLIKHNFSELAVFIIPDKYSLANCESSDSNVIPQQIFITKDLKKH